MTVEIVLVELLQLGLTLIVLAEITFLKSNSCVDLVHCHRKVILDTLDLKAREKKKNIDSVLCSPFPFKQRCFTMCWIAYSQILTDTLELITNIGVVLILTPLVFQELKSLSQNTDRSDSGWIRCLVEGREET